MLLTTDNEGRTVFHSAAKSFQIEVFQEIIILGKENLTTEEVKQLLLATVNKGGTVFHSAAKSNQMKIFQAILNLAKENLTTEEEKN